MELNKLVLGTVQFGLDYGVNNPLGMVSESEVSNILSLASSRSISIIDTSSAYGSSEAVLGKAIAETKTDFKIISKYPKSDISVQESFEQSLINLRQDRLYGYLVHHFDFYLSNPNLWSDMKSLRDKGFVEKIGFSLYSIDQLEYLIDNNVDFDIVQFPYNVFDRQFEPYFSLLKERKIEIHVRSVFLQGLFFKDLGALPKKLITLVPYLQSLRSYCSLKDITVEEFALNFVLNNDSIDGVLIGVDNSTQLHINIECAQKCISREDIDFINSILIENKELLNPVNWK